MSQIMKEAVREQRQIERKIDQIEETMFYTDITISTAIAEKEILKAKKAEFMELWHLVTARIDPDIQSTVSGDIDHVMGIK